MTIMTEISPTIRIAATIPNSMLRFIGQKDD